jgi:serine phosphatase RsbU (regulator of sigma subunit)
VQERTAELQETIEELNTSLLVINTQKKEIEKKNEDITASINYARRIQTAMLATEDEVQRSLPNSFIFFRPRDIVSGDFYYYQEVQHSIPTVEARVAQQIPYEYIHQQKIIMAAVDCTGHGVPGAFMSMVGNEILSEIINVKDIYQPSEILTELHKGIRKALKQQETMNKDGMDLALLTFTKENDKFIMAEYAGAMNPLYYFEVPKDREVAVFNEIKATKRPIGGQLDEKSHQTLYLNHTIQLQEDKNYTFYLFTDGFQDQFGGKHNKKFMVKRFKEMLYDIQHLDMLLQKVTITQTFEAWTEGYDQVDDVLVMGIRVM